MKITTKQIKVKAKLCNPCIYGSLGRCINCEGKDNWVVLKTFSTKGKPVFFIGNGHEEFMVINPKMLKKHKTRLKLNC